MPGSSGIETIDGCGGGKQIRLSEPNGYAIEVVQGIQTLQATEVLRQPITSGVAPFNQAGEVIRFAAGPSSVERIGHATLGPLGTRRPLLVPRDPWSGLVWSGGACPHYR